MYAAYFGLAHDPFSIAPDPHYLFMSERHREALAHLLYGLGAGGGFVLLTGEIGTGKTTLCRLFLEQIPPSCNVAYIFNPKLTTVELLQTVCGEFHVEVPPGASGKQLVDALNAFLLREHGAGRNNVLIIDEAQNLAPDVLEQLRLLTNLETRERKLLQIILIGQPELRDMLARPELEQLAQRVIARYHLGPLTREETMRYVQHRLEVAGLQRTPPFDRRALERVHELTRGVPRRINLLCDRALLGAYAQSAPVVNRRILDGAAKEVFGSPAASRTRERRAVFAGVAAVAAAAAAAVAFQVLGPGAAQPRAVVAATPAASAPALPASAASAPAVVARDAASAAPPAKTLPTLLSDADDAWRELARDWQADVDEAREPCRALAQRQLQCFGRAMPLAMVRELGRPGIVTLDADTAQPRYAILTSLTRDAATLRANGTEQTVTLSALGARWKGDFATLWRTPPGWTGRGEPRGAAGEWLSEKLAAANGLPSTPRWTDAQLRAQLRVFQVAHGLPADGQAGPMTYMQLNRASGVDEPRLRGTS